METLISQNKLLLLKHIEINVLKEISMSKNVVQIIWEAIKYLH